MDTRLVEQDLDEFVEGESWPEPSPGNELDPLPAPDPSAATGILRRLRRLGHEAETITTVAAGEIARIEAWRDDRVRGIEREFAWASRSLEAFARRVIPGSGKKSLPLPDGTLKLTGPGKGKVVVEDEAAVIAWAREHDAVSSDPENPGVVNLKPTVSKTVLGQHRESDEAIAVTIDDDGVECNVYALIGPDDQPIPGATRVVRADDKFDLTIGED